MQTTDLATAPAATLSRRLDVYVFIHKALRHQMCQVLLRLGALDPDDDTQRAAVLADVEQLLAVMKGHLQHENDFLHTAIEARRPGGARHTADDHLLHAEAFGNLEDEARALRDARPQHRAALALRLYRHLAVFVGENLVHMQVEETQNNALLWDLYSDAELEEIHDRLVASLPPAELANAARGMAASLAVPELALVFADMQAKAPAPAFEALLEIARTQLDEGRWAQLARALGRPPVPGLVTV